MLIKLIYMKQIHLYTGLINYSLIKEYCRRKFNQLPGQFDFYYLDDENDQIIMSSDADNQSFNGLLCWVDKKIIKINIKQREFQQLCMEQGKQQNQIENCENESYDYQNVHNNSSFQFQLLSSESDYSQVNQINHIIDDEKLYQLSKCVVQQKETSQRQHSKIIDIVDYQQKESYKQIKSIVGDFLNDVNNRVIENYKIKKQIQEESKEEDTTSMYVGISENQSVSDKFQQEQMLMQNQHEQELNSQINESSSIILEEIKDEEQLKVKIIEKKIEEMLPALMVKVDSLIEQRINQNIQRLFECI